MGRVFTIKGGNKNKQNAGALSKNGKIIIGIIVLLLVIAAGIGGYLYWKKYQATKNVVEAVVDAPVEAVEAAVQAGGRLLKKMFR